MSPKQPKASKLRILKIKPTHLVEHEDKHKIILK